MTHSWPIRLRLALLRPVDCRWNAWVRDATAWLERPSLPRPRKAIVYPYTDGDITVLGPQIFVSNDDRVINWRGINYVPQESSPHYIAGLLRGAVQSAVYIHREGIPCLCIPKVVVEGALQALGAPTEIMIKS